MKIYIDNELKDFRKVVSIHSIYNETIFDDIDCMIDALKALGYSEESIEIAFLEKCYRWDLIEPKDEI